MLILKMLGFMLTLISSLLFGFNKVSNLKARRDALAELCRDMEVLKDNLGFGLKELPRLLRECFHSCGFLEITGDYVNITGDSLSKEDKKIINEFFLEAGRLDGDRECERARLYIGLLNKQLRDAEEKLLNEGKLWKTLSLCIGIGGGILFL